MKKIGVYILTWDCCQYYYYGSSIDLDRRKRNHLNRLKNNKHENFILHNLFLKYGLPKFSVIEYCEHSDLKTTEQKYLDKARKDKYNINILNSVNGSGKVISSETRIKISNSLKGREFSEKHRNSLKIVNSGNNNPRYNKPVFKSTREKISLTKQGSNNPRAKKVINTQTGEIFGCAKDVFPNCPRSKYQNFILKLKNKIPNNTEFKFLETIFFNKTACGDEAIASSVKQEAHGSLANG